MGKKKRKKKEFELHVDQALSTVFLSVIAWVLMFIWGNGYEILGNSPIMVIANVAFHALLIWLLLYSNGKKKHNIPALVALTILIIEFGLTAAFGYSEAAASHKGASAGTCMAVIGIFKSIRPWKFFLEWK